MVIYKITNQSNNKVYIGQTSLSTNKRWKKHLEVSRGGSKTHFHRAIRKHGPEVFLVEVLDDTPTTKEELNEAEILYIKELQPEYNMTRGGDGGDTSKSPNYIAAMKKRDSSGKRNSMYGKRGVNNPNYGQKRGPTPKISEAKKVPVMARGNRYASIGEAETALNIKWQYSSKKYPEEYYRL